MQHSHHAADHAPSPRNPLNAMAASATLHCLTGCAIGEIAGLMIGTARGWGNLPTTVLAVALAFVFGYALSALPVVRSGLRVADALKLVLAADTLSIATMELVDNGVMLVIPGAMDAGLDNPAFWIAMAIALTAAFAAAFPVNRYLMARGKGHALTHGHHEGREHHEGQDEAGHDGHDGHGGSDSMATTAKILAAAIIGFLLGGLLVSISVELDDPEPMPTHSMAEPGGPSGGANGGPSGGVRA